LYARILFYVYAVFMHEFMLVFMWKEGREGVCEEEEERE
jgi:hypothetical protein